jgi:hypothetical protein
VKSGKREREREKRTFGEGNKKNQRNNPENPPTRGKAKNGSPSKMTL